MGHYVYKYVNETDNEIIYIGKNDGQLRNRIYQHTLEKSFQEYEQLSVYYFEVDSGYMSDAFETFLINKYKPRLNVAKINSSMDISFVEPKWIKYDENVNLNSKIIPRATKSKILKEVGGECELNTLTLCFTINYIDKLKIANL